MKLRKILAAAMAMTIVCGASAAVGAYQPGFELTANAWDYTEAAEDGIKYKVYADYAEVARNEGIAGDVNIASAVNGVPVTSIGFRAFEECQELTSITIPDGVTSIDDRAFCECSELASITLPDSLTSIGDDAFVSCSKLTSITLPEGLTSIGCDAFDECSGLTSMTIPDSVTSIGYGAFYLCSGLTSIIIPDGVTSIGDWTFYGCSALTSITIPESVTSISDKAFTDHSDVTICGYGGSYAETYANEKDIPFAAIEKAAETTTTTTTTSQPTTTTTTSSSSALDSRFVGKWELYKCEKNGEDVQFSPNGFELFADGEGEWTLVDGGKNDWTSVDDFLYVRDLTGLPIHIDKYEYLNGELVWKGMAEELDYNLAPETAEYDLNAYGEGVELYYRRVEDSEQTTTATTTTSQPTTTTTTTTTTSTAAQETTTTTATTPEQPAVSFGDPTGDGKIDAKDASFALVEYAKLSTGGESSLTEAEKSAADVNKDGKNDSKDASIILSYYAYISTNGTDSLEEFLKK